MYYNSVNIMINMWVIGYYCGRYVGKYMTDAVMQIHTHIPFIWQQFFF